MRGEIIVSLFRNEIMFVRQAKPFARSVDKLRTSLAVRFESPLHFRDAFSNQRVRNDEFRFAVIVLLRAVERVEKRLHVLAVDFLNIESVGLKSRTRVFALRHLRGRVEGDRI